MREYPLTVFSLFREKHINGIIEYQTEVFTYFNHYLKITLGKLVILGKSEQDVRHILFTKTSALPLNRGLIKLHFVGFGSLFSISVVILNISLLYYH